MFPSKQYRHSNKKNPGKTDINTERWRFFVSCRRTHVLNNENVGNISRENKLIEKFTNALKSFLLIGKQYNLVIKKNIKKDSTLDEH